MQSLKRYLERHQLTSAEFAERVGVGAPHITRLILGRRGASTDLLVKIHNETGIPLKVLINESKSDGRASA